MCNFNSGIRKQSKDMDGEAWDWDDSHCFLRKIFDAFFVFCSLLLLVLFLYIDILCMWLIGYKSSWTLGGFRKCLPLQRFDMVLRQERSSLCGHVQALGNGHISNPGDHIPCRSTPFRKVIYRQRHPSTHAYRSLVN